LARLPHRASPADGCVPLPVWSAFALSAGLVAILLMHGKPVEKDRYVRSRKTRSLRSQSFSDLICSGRSIRSGLALMRTHRVRPSDRTPQHSRGSAAYCGPGPNKLSTNPIEARSIPVSRAMSAAPKPALAATRIRSTSALSAAVAGRAGSFTKPALGV